MRFTAVIIILTGLIAGYEAHERHSRRTGGTYSTVTASHSPGLRAPELFKNFHNPLWTFSRLVVFVAGIALTLFVVAPDQAGTWGPQVHAVLVHVFGGVALAVPLYAFWLSLSGDPIGSLLDPMWTGKYFGTFVRRGEWTVVGLCGLAALAVGSPAGHGSVEAGGGLLGSWLTSWSVVHIGTAFTATILCIMAGIPLWSFVSRMQADDTVAGPIIAALLTIVGLLVPIAAIEYTRTHAPWEYAVTRTSKDSYDVFRSVRAATAEKLAVVGLESGQALAPATVARTTLAQTPLARTTRSGYLLVAEHTGTDTWPAKNQCVKESTASRRLFWTETARPATRKNETHSCASNGYGVIMTGVRIQLPVLAPLRGAPSRALGPQDTPMLEAVGRRVCADAFAGFRRRAAYDHGQLVTMSGGGAAKVGACVAVPE